LRGSRSIVSQSITRRGYLGVGVVEINAERAKALKLSSDSGVEVMHVDEDSPASKAGLRVNDIILELNGQKVDEVEQFVKTIGDTAPGGKVDLTILRSGTKQNLSARVDSRRVVVMNGPGGPITENFIGPNGPRGMDDFFPGFVADSPKVGFEGEMLTPQLAEFFGVKEGVLVRTVNAKSPAERAGLKAGDVVTKVNGTPISSPREVSALLRSSRKTAIFTVTRNRKEITLNVEIAEDRGLSPERVVL
jgi:serine protease Do